MTLLTAMQSSDRANFEKLYILLVDDNPQALQILSHVMTGFGAKHLFKAPNGVEALEILRSQEIDLLISDANMPEMDGYDLIHLLRREGLEKNRFIPAVLLTGHTRLRDVIRARDCGASFTVAKPITPAIVLQRVFWCAQEERMFVETETYVGPDRRFKRLGPQDGMTGRRFDDPPERLGDAPTPIPSQDQIDDMTKPKRVSL